MEKKLCTRTNERERTWKTEYAHKQLTSVATNFDNQRCQEAVVLCMNSEYYTDLLLSLRFTEIRTEIEWAKKLGENDKQIDLTKRLQQNYYEEKFNTTLYCHLIHLKSRFQDW